MAKKFPKVIYGAWFEEGTKDEYVSCAEEPDSFVDAGQSRIVGRYELMETLEMTAPIQSKPVLSTAIRKKN